MLPEPLTGPWSMPMSAAPGRRAHAAPGTVLPALAAALGTAMLGLPRVLEGTVLFAVSRQHGVTYTDLVAGLLVVAGLWAASRAAGQSLWRWGSAPGRSFLFAAAAGLGLGGSLLGDRARWVWLLSAALVHVGCRYEEQGGRHEA